LDELRTKRMRLRPYKREDINSFAEMYGDVDVTAHTLLGRRNKGEATAILVDYMSFFAIHGYGMLAAVDATSGEYLGECGVFLSPLGTLALRYTLRKQAWGRGLAVEAASAVIDDAFSRLRLRELVAGVKPLNEPSMRVMAKLGFSFVKTMTAAGVEFYLFRTSEEAWRAVNLNRTGFAGGSNS
jgi:[ribosomal protein S5]-alanine N-acetyltransferase